MVVEFEFVSPGQQARVITYIYNTCMTSDVNKDGCVRVVLLSILRRQHHRHNSQHQAMSIGQRNPMTG